MALCPPCAQCPGAPLCVYRAAGIGASVCEWSRLLLCSHPGGVRLPHQVQRRVGRGARFILSSYLRFFMRLLLVFGLALRTPAVVFGSIRAPPGIGRPRADAAPGASAWSCYCGGGLRLPPICLRPYARGYCDFLSAAVRCSYCWLSALWYIIIFELAYAQPACVFHRFLGLRAGRNMSVIARPASHGSVVCIASDTC